MYRSEYQYVRESAVFEISPKNPGEHRMVDRGSKIMSLSFNQQRKAFTWCI